MTTDLTTQPEGVYDLLDGAFYAADPHAAWAWMREHQPVYRDERNDVWALTRYADVLAASRDPDTFSNAGGIRPHGGGLPMMIEMDDPDHLRRRKLVNRGFTPRQVRDRETRIREVCDSLIDAVAAEGRCDFVWDLAAPLPLIVIGDMLGMPEERHADLLEWSDALVGATTSTDESAAVRAAAAMEAFREFQMGVIADRRRSPGDDLVSVLVHAEVDGSALDDEELLYESLLILIGGDETTRHVISGGMYELMTRPDQRQKLLDDPSRLDVAVEEMLRWVTPIKNMNRTVTRDVEIGGERLGEGDQVLLFYPSANRDETVFDRPFDFDVERRPNEHLAFGFGAHFCLGANLARLELRVMFERLLERLPDMALADDEPLPVRPANFISGFESMPVEFSPA